MNPDILFENEELVVINKPSGVMVHTDGKNSDETVADWFVKKYPDAKDVGEPIEQSDGTVLNRPGIVHRLDKETSGVLVLAKNQESFLHIKEQFQNREVAKTYHAFVYGVMKDDEGVIDRPIGRSSKDFRLWSAQRGARGTLREAVTKYTVLNRGNGCSFIKLLPKTGRTHQLRVHLKAINYPIVCDSLYAPKRECLLGFSRLALHASAVSLVDRNGESVEAEALLPQEFEEAKKSL